jgi:hypothetical protein
MSPDMISENDTEASSPHTAGDFASLWKRAELRTVPDGIWVLPFSRGGAASEVFLVDRNITSEPDRAKAKKEVEAKLRQLIAGPELG